MVLFCFVWKYPIKHMPNNQGQYFNFKPCDHIIWHLEAQSIQGIFNFRPNAKKLPGKASLALVLRFLKTMDLFFCWFTILVLLWCRPAKTEQGWGTLVFPLPFQWMTCPSPVLTSSCFCVGLFPYLVMNVLGLWGTPSIQLSHSLSVREPFPMCVVVGMLCNKLCLHLICTLTN